MSLNLGVSIINVSSCPLCTIPLRTGVRPSSRFSFKCLSPARHITLKVMQVTWSHVATQSRFDHYTGRWPLCPGVCTVQACTGARPALCSVCGLVVSILPDASCLDDMHNIRDHWSPSLRPMRSPSPAYLALSALHPTGQPAPVQARPASHFRSKCVSPTGQIAFR